MQNVFRNSSCVVSGGQPCGHDPAGPDREIRLVGDFRAPRPARCSAGSERCRCRRTRRRTDRRAPATPSASCRRGTTSTRPTDRRRSFFALEIAMTASAADVPPPITQDRLADVLRRRRSSQTRGLGRCRGCRTGAARRDRRPARRGGRRRRLLGLRLWFQATTFQTSPSRSRPVISTPTCAGTSILAIQRLPVSRTSRPCRSARTAGVDSSSPPFGNCMRSPPP